MLVKTQSDINNLALIDKIKARVPVDHWLTADGEINRETLYVFTIKRQVPDGDPYLPPARITSQSRVNKPVIFNKGALMAVDCAMRDSNEYQGLRNYNKSLRRLVTYLRYQEQTAVAFYKVMKKARDLAASGQSAWLQDNLSFVISKCTTIYLSYPHARYTFKHLEKVEVLRFLTTATYICPINQTLQLTSHWFSWRMLRDFLNAVPELKEMCLKVHGWQNSGEWKIALNPKTESEYCGYSGTLVEQFFTYLEEGYYKEYLGENGDLIELLIK